MRQTHSTVVFVRIYVMLLYSLFTLLLATTAFGQLNNIFLEKNTVVHTDKGAVNGSVEKTYDGREYISFQGIPYAKPPVGELRFKPPQPADSWETVRNATQPPQPCIQVAEVSGEVEGSEDCLYLNVYTPQVSSSSLLPVLVYIHGGAFMFGSPDTNFLGPDYFILRKFVVVYPQYRLSVFGFLTTGDAVVPGNNGLKDQVMALRWVKENIKKFGGNPDLVTLAGHSAGGSSVDHLLLSPLTRDAGLFHRAIAQSGSSLNPWNHNSQFPVRSRKVAEILGCPTGESEKMVECLRGKEEKKIAETVKKFQPLVGHPKCLFGPVVEVDGDPEWNFMPKHPEELLSEGLVSSVPFLTGMTSEEGAFLMVPFVEDEYMLADMDENLNRVFAPVVDYHDNPDSRKITSRVQEFYLGNKTIEDEEYVPQIIKAVTDYVFICGIHKGATLHAKHGRQPVYLYYFTFRGKSSFTNMFSFDRKNYGVSHVDDLFYVFRNPISDEFKIGSLEHTLTETLVDLWTNFAKTGNPTPKTESMPFHWDALDVRNSTVNYLELKPHPEMSTDFPYDRMEFWENDVLHRQRDEL